MKPHIASLLLLTLCLLALPAAAQVVYDNGPINGTVDAWTINVGFAVSDTFTVANGGATINGLSFGSWTIAADPLDSVEVTFSSNEFGGTVYSDQVVNLTQTGCVVNQFGYNVCTSSGSFGTPVTLNAGTYWMTLDNACCTLGDPLFWDENSGPSRASENSVGTIPSESFTLFGSSGSGPGTGPGSTPEPSSLVLFASGILGTAGFLRRKLF